MFLDNLATIASSHHTAWIILLHGPKHVQLFNGDIRGGGQYRVEQRLDPPVGERLQGGDFLISRQYGPYRVNFKKA